MDGLYLNRAYWCILACKVSQAASGLTLVGTYAWLLYETGSFSWEPLVAITFFAVAVGVMFGLPAWYAYSHVVVIRGTFIMVQLGKTGRHAQCIDLSLPFSLHIDRRVGEDRPVILQLRQDGSYIDVPSSTTSFNSIVGFVGVFDADILDEELPDWDSGFNEGGYG